MIESVSLMRKDGIGIFPYGQSDESRKVIVNTDKDENIWHLMIIHENCFRIL